MREKSRGSEVLTGAKDDVASDLKTENSKLRAQLKIMLKERKQAKKDLDAAAKKASELAEANELERSAKAGLAASFQYQLEEKEEMLSVLQTQVAILRETPSNAAKESSTNQVR